MKGGVISGGTLIQAKCFDALAEFKIMHFKK
jgi:hypothetical protein